MRKGSQWREGELRGFSQNSICRPACESRAVATVRHELVPSFLRDLWQSGVLELLLPGAAQLNPTIQVGSEHNKKRLQSAYLLPCSLAQQHLLH